MRRHDPKSIISAARRKGVLLLAFVVIGIGASTHRARADVHLWPFYDKEEDQLTIMYPFYVKDSAFTMAFPFYYHVNASNETHILWPLIKVSDGKITRVAPFYFSGDNEFTLLPFIWRTPEFTMCIIPPVYVNKADDVHMVLPLYVKAGERTFIFPNMYHSTGEQSGVSGYDFWPFVKVRDGPRRSVRALYPFFSRSKETYSNGGATEEKMNVLWPIYARKQVVSKNGKVIERSRRFLLFSDHIRGNTRTMRILGLPIMERIR